MRFYAPDFLWLLLLLPPVLLLGLHAERFAKRARQVFAAPPSARQRWRSVGRILLAGLAVLALALALAGPRVQTRTVGDKRYATRLAVGLDVSKSMLAEDVAPVDEPLRSNLQANRLTAAGRFASQLFDAMAGESAGLFFFARNGIEVVTPTRDRGFLRYMVQHTRLADLTESGSSLAAALDTASAMLTGGQRQQTAAIVLITDGEDTETSLASILEKAQTLRKRNIPVFTVGVGGQAEVFIPIRSPNRSQIAGFYTDSRGSYLRTRQQTRPLREIAAATGGAYYALDAQPATQLAPALLQHIAAVTPPPGAQTPRRTLRDAAPLLLLASALFYALYILL